jgi:hypothetical protein
LVLEQNNYKEEQRPNIKLDESIPFDPREIAHEELRQHKLPMMICENY